MGAPFNVLYNSSQFDCHYGIFFEVLIVFYACNARPLKHVASVFGVIARLLLFVPVASLVWPHYNNYILPPSYKTLVTRLWLTKIFMTR